MVSLREGNSLKMYRKIKVLIADDQESFAVTLANRLRQKQIETEYVFSGEAMLESAQRMLPDVVVLDFWMPGMSSLELLQQFKICYPGIEVIFITSEGAFIDTGIACMQLGAFDYIMKPVEINHLIEVILSASSHCWRGN